jgi:hypothetical protein
MPPATPKAVAIHTNHVALRDFSQELLAALQRGPAGAQREALLTWIPVIEVHLMGHEPTTAVGTRDIPQLAEKRRRRFLTSADALDFLFAICRVVANVVRPLIA